MTAEDCNFIIKETMAQVFSGEFCKISKNTFSYRTWMLLNFNEQISQNLFSFSEVTQANILKEINFIKNKKATTFNTIPPKVLKIS